MADIDDNAAMMMDNGDTSLLSEKSANNHRIQLPIPNNLTEKSANNCRIPPLIPDDFGK